MAYSMETRVSKLEEKTKNHEIRLHSLEDVNKSINDINLNIQKIALTQEGMLKTMQREQEIRKDHDKRLQDLEQKPIKNYEKVKWIILTAVLSAIASGVVGWVLGYFLK